MLSILGKYKHFYISRYNIDCITRKTCFEKPISLYNNRLQHYYRSCLIKVSHLLYFGVFLRTFYNAGFWNYLYEINPIYKSYLLSSMLQILIFDCWIKSFIPNISSLFEMNVTLSLSLSLLRWQHKTFSKFNYE